MVIKVVGAFALLGLNVMFIAFFVFWSIADTASINQMESFGGYDPALLMPNADLMWVSAYASLALLIITDLCAAALLIVARKKTSAYPEGISQQRALATDHQGVASV